MNPAESRAVQIGAMLFLMNDVVLSLDEAKMAPRSVGLRFRALPMASVSKLGQEFYAETPLLHLTRPERAKRLAALIVSKSPGVNAAQFIAPSFGCPPAEVSVRYATVDRSVMARLAERQDEGLLDTVWTDRQVWRRLAA